VSIPTLDRGKGDSRKLLGKMGHRAFKGMLNKEILLIQKNDLNK
jgi:hypothetical protein